MDWREIKRAIFIRTSLVLVGLGAISSFLYDPPFVTGILLGGILTMGNLYVMQDNIVRLFEGTKGLKGAKTSVVGKFYIRLLLLGLLIYLLLKWGIQPIALAIGLGSLVIGIISLALIPVKETKEAL
ncbi:MAG: ATP synthase subunit I [Desulfatiglandales bacterium]